MEQKSHRAKKFRLFLRVTEKKQSKYRPTATGDVI